MSRASLSPDLRQAGPSQDDNTTARPACIADVTLWHIHRDCPERLLGADGRPSSDWNLANAISIVKTGPHRTVYRLDLPAGGFYLKHYRASDWKAVLRNVFRDTPAVRELRAAQRIAALRLVTFEPMATGVTRRLGLTCDSYLITRAIRNALPLDHFLLTDFQGLDPRRQSELRQRLARELGRLSARLHERGIEHIDLHAGNLLIRIDAGPAEPLLALIDLHAVRFHAGQLSPARSKRNIATLHQFFAGRSSRSDRRRFLRAYQENLAAPADSHLEAVLDRAAHAGWRRADRAWHRGNRHVRRLDAGRIRCRALATLEGNWIEELRDAPGQVLERCRVRWCKQSKLRRVAEVVLGSPGSPGAQHEATARRIDRPSDSAASGIESATPAEGITRAFLKEFTENGITARLASIVRLSAARRAWETGHALLRRGIDTPRPLMYVERPEGLGRRLYLLTEAVDQTIPLSQFFGETWLGLTTSQQARWIESHLTRAAAMVRQLHDAGFDHRDLKFPNLLVSTELEVDRVWLLDLDAIARRRAIGRSRAVQNLSRLNVSSLLVPDFRMTSRLRFLKRYLGAARQPEWKGWWREIATRSQKKIHQNHQRGRPLS